MLPPDVFVPCIHLVGNGNRRLIRDRLSHLPRCAMGGPVPTSTILRGSMYVIEGGSDRSGGDGESAPRSDFAVNEIQTCQIHFKLASCVN